MGTVFLVAGVDRSGTSAAAGALSAGGVDMGRWSPHGDRFNAKGYVEDAVAHGILLRAFESKKRPTFGQYFRVREGQYGFKDPLLCWYLTDAIAAARAAGHSVRVVYVYRPLDEILLSQAAANRDLDPAQVLVKWWSLGQQLQDHAELVTTVRYPELLQDAAAELRTAGLDLPEPEDPFVDQTLRRQRGDQFYRTLPQCGRLTQQVAGVRRELGLEVSK